MFPVGFLSMHWCSELLHVARSPGPSQLDGPFLGIFQVVPVYDVALRNEQINDPYKPWLLKKMRGRVGVSTRQIATRWQDSSTNET